MEKKGNLKIRNFLSQFRDRETNEFKEISANEFMEICNHYDKDGNGYIEGEELDKFLYELCTSVNKEYFNILPRNIFIQFKQAIMDAYDEDKDGRIKIQELAEILPTEETFLLIFRQNNSFSTQDFIRIWNDFDINKSKYIEVSELESFLTELLEIRKNKNIFITREKIKEYTNSILFLFDKNKDGKLQLSEMIKLLSPPENVYLKDFLLSFSSLTEEKLDEIFKEYDQDGNDLLDEEEINNLSKDLLNLIKADYSIDEFNTLKYKLIRLGDLNFDGKLNKNELRILLQTLITKKSSKKKQD